MFYNVAVVCYPCSDETLENVSEALRGAIDREFVLDSYTVSAVFTDFGLFMDAINRLENCYSNAIKEYQMDTVTGMEYMLASTVSVN